MKIRDEQMHEFDRAAEAEFRRRVVAHLRKHHAEAIEEFGDEELDLLVQAGIAKARSYGLTWQLTIAGFVALMIEVGPNFDRFTPIQKLLADDRLPPDERFDRILKSLPAEVWERAAEFCELNEENWPDAPPEGE